MGKWMRSIFLLILCAVISCGGNIGNMIYSGEKTGNDVYGSLLGDRVMKGKNKEFYLYIDNGKMREISYISYHVEIREDADGNRGGREVTVIRVVRK